MVKRESTAPFLFFILDLPSGISSGLASIALPFILTQAALSVAAAGYIVALGVSANLWRFLWGPVADFTLTRFQFVRRFRRFTQIRSLPELISFHFENLRKSV